MLILRYCNFIYFAGIETLRKYTVCPEFQMIYSKICGNCSFSRKSHTRKLDKISLLSEQSLFVDVKQPSDNKIFVSNTIGDTWDKTEIKKYNDKKICGGIIKSIVPNIIKHKSYLRSYPKPKSTLNVSWLIQIMRSYFSEKDFSSTLTEMSISV